jgi:hypothetical protein
VALTKRRESDEAKFRPGSDDSDAVLNKLGQSAAIGQDREGTPEAYFFAKGAPGTFYVLDAATGA